MDLEQGTGEEREAVAAGPAQRVGAQSEVEDPDAHVKNERSSSCSTETWLALGVETRPVQEVCGERLVLMPTCGEPSAAVFNELKRAPAARRQEARVLRFG